MRIIGGNFKGKKLFLPDDKKTRPLKDIVKESIFNLIEHSNKIKVNIKNSVVLDLFSGSGSFGLECLSRNAKKVFFFENYPVAIEVLNKNVKSLKDINNYRIFEYDCFDYFKSVKNLDYNCDIIFIDPPYKETKINEIIENILIKKILNKNGIIIIHRNKNETKELTKKINIFESRTYGISKIFFGN